MRDFQFVVRDSRYSVTSQTHVAFLDEEAARDVAEATLRGASQNMMIEVWEHDRRLFSIGARTTQADPFG